MRESLECLLRAAQRLNDVVVEVCELLDIACAGPPTVDSVDQLGTWVRIKVSPYGDGINLVDRE